MLDLDEIRGEWLNQCGPCDFGMPEYPCTHPHGDYRPVMLALVNEVERLRADAPLLDAYQRLEIARQRLLEAASGWRSRYVAKIDEHNRDLFRDDEYDLIRAVDTQPHVVATWYGDGRRSLEVTEVPDAS